ncbi:hypothetical protein BJV78DRAFT_727513 [Lactifluus subvellereus]|nr:hypothetical protein BJV78DRAFT_727513 [Lactifluus subvellereus]
MLPVLHVPCTRRHSQSRLTPYRISKPFPGTRIELGRIHMTEEHHGSHDVMEGWCDPSRPFQLPRDECLLPKRRMTHPLNESDLPNNSNVMYNRTALRPRVSRVAAATVQRPRAYARMFIAVSSHPTDPTRATTGPDREDTARKRAGTTGRSILAAGWPP